MERCSEYWVKKNNCWKILPKKVNCQYSSETLLKQISLWVFLNYFINILVVSFFEYFFKEQKQSPLAILQKRCFLKNGTVVPESSFKVAGCFKKRPWHRSFSVNFSKFLRIAMFCRTSTKVWFSRHPISPTVSQTISFFNCLDTKNF